MLPLIDGAGYKLFDAKMFSLTDGARNKLFGTKMLAPSPFAEVGFFHGRHLMIISEGYFYHISDSYFELANEDTLMSNYENGGYRPHYLAIRDSENADIFWMVPVSSRYSKFQGIYQKQVAKYGKCTKIVLGKCGGKDAAFLVQNAFPITSDYFDHIHTSQGKPLTLHESTSKLIVSCLQNNLRLNKRGIRLFFADIDRLYKLMLDHISENAAQTEESNPTT